MNRPPPNPPISYWDRHPEHVDRVRKLWTETDKSATEIAEILGDGCTKGIVIGKVHRLRCARRIDKTEMPDFRSLMPHMFEDEETE